MVEVNGACSRHANIWLNILHVMSKAKVFATQDGQTNITDYIDLFVIYMDPKSAAFSSPHMKDI